jgi:tetraacyldisaccharide 4'-kinase
MPELAGLRGWLQRRWYGDTPPLLLRPLSLLYGWVVCARRALHAKGWLAGRHPGVPVIVVGNITVGGTGKTPLVIWLATALAEAGQRPGVVLRGYAGKAIAPRTVSADDSPVEVGDEAVLIARRTRVPVAIGRDRVAAARLLVDAGCNLVIADDGLQHLALRRDLSIAVIDGARGFGNGALLPAGPLREPASALQGVDFVVVHGEGRVPPAVRAPLLRMSLRPGALRSLQETGEESPGLLRGCNVHAVAGIGHPARFFALLRSLGATPVEHAFPDHHTYVPRDFAFDEDLRIVMTEKDAVKCAAFADPRMWYLPVHAELSTTDAARLLHAALALVPGDQRHA